MVRSKTCEVTVFVEAAVRCICLCINLLLLFDVSFIPGGLLWFPSVPVMGKTTAAPRAALPIPANVCSIFVCPDYGMAAGVMGF